MSQNSKLSALHEQGIHLAQEGHFEDALEKLNNALKEQPLDPELHYHLALVYKNLKNTPLFIEHLNHTLKIRPHEILAHFELANFYKNQNDFKNALKHYNESLKEAPDFTLAHFALGQLFLKHHYFKEAKIEFNNVLALSPGHLKAHFHLGIIGLSENDLDEAKAQFQLVLALDKDDIEALTNLGVIALKEDLGQEAIAYFTKALILNPQYEDARSNLAATFMHYDRYENALVHYQILLEEHPQNQTYLYNKAVAMMTLGQLKEALETFENLISFVPKHFEAITNIAAIYLRLGQKDKAKFYFDKAHVLRPDDKMTAFMQNALAKTPLSLNASPEYAQALFDQYALYYDEHMNKVLKYALPHTLQASLVTLGLEKVDSILDLGCGTGLSGDILRPYAIRLEGVDISPKMLKIAKNKFLYDVLYEKEILSFLKEEASSYNMIVALDVLPYFGELETLINLVSKHLKPNGYFIFSSEIAKNQDIELQTTLRFCHKPEYVDALLKKYTFEIVQEKTLDARMHDQNMIKVRFIMAKH